jgi:hypothetical protein
VAQLDQLPPETASLQPWHQEAVDRHAGQADRQSEHAEHDRRDGGHPPRPQDRICLDV